MLKFVLKIKKRFRKKSVKFFFKFVFLKPVIFLLEKFYRTDWSREIIAKSIVDPDYKHLFAGDRSRGLLLNKVHSYNHLRMRKLMIHEILSKSKGKRIIIGPWLAEVGYEVLYWSPFINYLIQNKIIVPEKSIVLTRGSAHVWYPKEIKKRIEMFEFISPEEFKKINKDRIQETSSEKHIKFTQSELNLIKKCVKDYDELTDYILHPSIMYNFLSSWIKSGEGKKFLDRTLAPRKHAELVTNKLLDDLPENYDVIRFYSRDSMPNNKLNREFALDLIFNLIKKRPVIVLNSSFNFDNHDDFPVSLRQNIITIDHLMTPQNNLALQSAVIAKANCYYGTYGGLSYVPIFYGVPVVSFYSNKKGLNTVHQGLANNIAMEFEVSFSVFKVDDFKRMFLENSNNLTLELL